ncbi:MAG: radical SAM/SPASM domain-containing protein [Desulfatirhabdiaceae bacterium]
MGYFKELLPEMLRYRLARRGLIRPGNPINLTFSVTNMCQSRCKTCGIWKFYQTNPNKQSQELTLNEIEKIFRSMGHIYIFNISGGEPFLRSDLADIIKLACLYLTPGIIHIPTNAIAVDRVEKCVRRILAFLKDEHPGVRLTVKPSLDHIGQKHDEIRGVPGNFQKVILLFERLKPLEADYPNFHLELGTVISRWNVDDIAEIARFVTSLGVGSYRNEIAEQRAEMFNQADDIAPSPTDYERAVDFFIREIRNNMGTSSRFQRVTQAFRLVYYQLAISIMSQNRQVIPCYAGISNAHLTPYGDVWTCCTLGDHQSMGNLQAFDYHFNELCTSSRARSVRQFIHQGQCHCPLANQAYSNILMHGPSLLKALRHILMPKMS